jgi:uncharacterized membrane protein
MAIAVGQLPLRRSVRIAMMTLLMGWSLVAAVGLVRNLYHLATDTVGGVGVGVVVVLVCALAIDAVSGTVSNRLGPRVMRLVGRRWQLTRNT